MLRTSPVFKQSTLIVIAHRIDTIIDSDMVMVMDAGNLVEMGKPDELVAKGGIFATMVIASGKAKKKEQESKSTAASASSVVNPLVSASSSNAAPKSRGLLDGDAPPPVIGKAVGKHRKINTMTNSKGRLGTSLDGLV